MHIHWRKKKSWKHFKIAHIQVTAALAILYVIQFQNRQLDSVYAILELSDSSLEMYMQLLKRLQIWEATKSCIDF